MERVRDQINGAISLIVYVFLSLISSIYTSRAKGCSKQQKQFCKQNSIDTWTKENDRSIIKILITLFYLISRTSTMIDIITTRFREAYTWIIPPEHERLQTGNYRREHMLSMKRFSDELHRRFSSETEASETHVIIFLCSHFFVNVALFNESFMDQ